MAKTRTRPKTWRPVKTRMVEIVHEDEDTGGPAATVRPPRDKIRAARRRPASRAR
jgi:hypothetical protein